jgi:predicted AAA+ superfamily ATPase
MQNKALIRDILLIQKRELERRLVEKYIDRAVDTKKFENDLIKVIIGPRRAGKSFLAVHILDKLGSFGYINFDDEKLVEMEDYDSLINAVNSIYENPKYLLFDEIQNLEKWELFVNRLQRQGYNLVITGSNSKLLSKELASHLTGRYLLINVFPFSFKEFLDVESKELTMNEIKERLMTYLIYGGYPEPLIKNIDYKDYLSTLFNSIIYKDIVKRFRIRSIQAIEDLAVYLVSNIAGEFSYNTLTRITKTRSVHTVEKYLNHLEEAFIFFRINRFSHKVKEQIYSNIVAIELKKLEMNGLVNIYFWRSDKQEEVDFVVKQGLKVERLIQVCYDAGDIKTKEREVKALLKAGEELKCRNLFILTDDYEAEETKSWFGIKGKIKFIPLWKWLLTSQ